jgi:hypothetical protein
LALRERTPDFDGLNRLIEDVLRLILLYELVEQVVG